MPNVWLYHINPKSSYGYTYGWRIDRPASILRSGDRTWSSREYFNRVLRGDLICVYMKNIGDKPDGVHVVGTVTDIAPQEAKFIWRPDIRRSSRTLVSPIPPEIIKRFFPRSYGHSIQPLRGDLIERWLRLLGKGEETDLVPRIQVRRPPKEVRPPQTDPIAMMEHGQLGEAHVLKILRSEYPRAKGFKIVHVSRAKPSADHDLAVMRNNRIVQVVEVKTRVGKAGDPVPISERQIALRRANRGRHVLFVVYLASGSTIREVVRIGTQDAYTLTPLGYWLHPGQL